MTMADKMGIWTVGKARKSMTAHEVIDIDSSVRFCDAVAEKPKSPVSERTVPCPTSKTGVTVKNDDLL